MSTIIGLTGITKDADYKCMVNADAIAYFRADDEGYTEIMMTGGYLLLVREDVYRIAEMIDSTQIADF